MQDESLGELGCIIEAGAYVLGQAVGLERAVKHLREQAVEQFIRRDDDLACTLRSLADTLQVEAKKQRATHESAHRANVHDAFDELDRRQAQAEAR
jgi:hypothetical protein